MKSVSWFLIFLVLVITACWHWQSRRSLDELTIALQQAQFLRPQMSQEAIMAELKQRRQRPLAVPETFQPDIGQAVEAEFLAWQRQFEKGTADRRTRLDWQQQTEAMLKQGMHAGLREQAWLEQQLQDKFPPITVDQAREWFTLHAEEMRVPPLHRVSHLFLSRHDLDKPNRAVEIQALSAQLGNSPASFAALVLKHSEDSRSKDHGGDLGWFSAARMPADFMQAVGKLAVGEISKPVETKLGWHILRKTDYHDSRLPTFDEVHEEIAALLDQQRRENSGI
jgi:hypothetical protein